MNEKYLNKISLGDCLKIMPHIEENSIDLILCDLPYGVSKNKWDSIIPLEPLWDEYKRILKPSGVAVLTASQPFSSLLVMSNPTMFKQEWIWLKTVGSGQLNISHRPLQMHESILVFYSKLPVYNQQMTKGKPYHISRDTNGTGYGKQAPSEKTNDGYRHPKSVLCIPNPRTKGGHPTQKPVELFEYFIKTYTNEEMVVLDNCIGSGTTAIAAIRTGRNFIGIELERDYALAARRRVKNER